MKPPVIPSISRTSPAKKMFGMSLLCIVLKSTSLRLMPPQVTNSSLLVVFPEMIRLKEKIFPAKFDSCLEEMLSHFVSEGIPERDTRYSQRR